MPRLSPIEKLARDICWAEWSANNRNVQCYTKATWWLSLEPDSRSAYMRLAERFVVIVKRLKPLRILTLVDIK